MCVYADSIIVHILREGFSLRLRQLLCEFNGYNAAFTVIRVMIVYACTMYNMHRVYGL